ncbi:MAG TPA: efflux RND transporter permease subunit [Candidatus Limnocylindrales bacterium]|nr:efflux RND transporter permease subunit [Candidatus Limnocylindrales bacterium]
MSFLARLSLANRGLIALITIAILGFGAAILPQLRQQMFPNIQFPQVTVQTSYPGASPELVEQQVTVPIEQTVAALDGVTLVTSNSRVASSSVVISFDYGVDIKQMSADVSSALSRITGRLPTGLEPRVLAGSTDDIPVITLAATGVAEDVLRDRVIPEFNSIAGVREATLNGARAKQVTVTLNPAEMAKRGVGVQSVTQALTANGVSTAGGSITEAGRSYSVAVGGRFTSTAQLSGLYLNPSTKLGDVARIEPTQADIVTITRTNGKPSLGIAVTAVPGANAVEISHAVSDLIPTLESETGADLAVVFDQAPEVEKSIRSLTTEGMLGLAFAVLVILVFLLSVRSTLVTAVSIPVSVIMALIALWAADYSLNMLTLGGLTIAIGRVVDDSIVVLENIKRHLAGGEAKQTAIITAVKEVAGAVTASTLTTVAVFLPIALVGGLVGQFFGPFGLTVTAALLASLIVSLTIVPVLAYWFLKPPKHPKPHEAEASGRLQRLYVPVLRLALRWRWSTLLVAALIIGATGYLATRIETSFIGGSGTTLSINQTLPPGTSLDSTDATAKRVEQILSELDGVKAYQAVIGGGGGTFGGGAGLTPNRATYRVTTEDGVNLAEISDEIRSRIEALGPDMGDISVGGMGGGGFGSSNLAVEVKAADEATLRQAAEQVRAAVAELDNVTEVKTDLAANTPQIQITLDRAAAGRLGMTDASVGQLINTAFRGTQISRIMLEGTEQPVIIRSGAAPTDVASLRALPIAPNVKLDDVADVETVAGPGVIRRVDQARTATVTAVPTTEGLGGLNAALDQKLKSLTLPPGASYSVGGVTREQRDAFSDLYLAMLVAIALVLIVMIGTFRGLGQPLILLISIPFAATGALGLLALTGEPLGLPAMIGLLMLIGIVVTNAIVLLDLINQYRASGLDARESIIEGGRRRLRPILMTAVATIFALLPMSLGLTESSAFISQPLAVVVIGGLVTSTLLTLVLVPVLYSLVEGAKARLRPAR